MLTICNHGHSLSTRFIRLAGLAACALLATACHGGFDSPTGPGTSTEAMLSASVGNDGGDSTRRMTVAMTEANLSGYSGECSLAAARGGFRLKAQGQGPADTEARFHLIKSDGFRTTALVLVGRQGTFRTGQDLVTFFPPNEQVRCVILSLDGTVLAESTTFIAP